MTSYRDEYLNVKARHLSDFDVSVEFANSQASKGIIKDGLETFAASTNRVKLKSSLIYIHYKRYQKNICI